MALRRLSRPGGGSSAKLGILSLISDDEDVLGPEDFTRSGGRCCNPIPPAIKSTTQVRYLNPSATCYPQHQCTAQSRLTTWARGPPRAVYSIIVTPTFAGAGRCRKTQLLARPAQGHSAAFCNPLSTPKKVVCRAQDAEIVALRAAWRPDWFSLHSTPPPPVTRQCAGAGDDLWEEQQGGAWHCAGAGAVAGLAEAVRQAEGERRGTSRRRRNIPNDVISGTLRGSRYIAMDLGRKTEKDVRFGQIAKRFASPVPHGTVAESQDVIIGRSPTLTGQKVPGDIREAECSRGLAHPVAKMWAREVTKEVFTSIGHFGDFALAVSRFWRPSFRAPFLLDKKTKP
ncbi:hypothetical protein B0T17DRAFT_507431 [Bombardia bombarda]|uniref:Uncharacterized protein n=1 Tax=Bombardia bombarda TaxID=252184 RepID=A0AA39XBR2_9PEZI|nr:hypothetical protein B0T17DRAFT_507431 [Bombardia bombarda]